MLSQPTSTRAQPGLGQEVSRARAEAGGAKPGVKVDLQAVGFLFFFLLHPFGCHVGGASDVSLSPCTSTYAAVYMVTSWEAFA